MRDGGEPPSVFFTGKVVELIYDCHGRFEGFVLAGCCGEIRSFRTSECAFSDILLKACKGCLLVTVILERRGKEESASQFRSRIALTDHGYRSTPVTWI